MRVWRGAPRSFLPASRIAGGGSPSPQPSPAGRGSHEVRVSNDRSASDLRVGISWFPAGSRRADGNKPQVVYSISRGVYPNPCSWRSAAVSAAHGVSSPRGQFTRQRLIHHSVNLFRCGKCTPQPRLDGVSRRDGGGPTAWFRFMASGTPVTGS